jgi:hypothetical protein
MHSRFDLLELRGNNSKVQAVGAQKNRAEGKTLNKFNLRPFQGLLLSGV